ncbi:unnamed protein product [Adineta steineri]|uniref:Uncharacterized protein n=1 Tax=Adineta steineri TaxID=433720 RepID=A0A814LRU9_9BILA|nr:unnamed protein product [Adineta steineri]
MSSDEEDFSDVSTDFDDISTDYEEYYTTDYDDGEDDDDDEDDDMLTPQPVPFRECLRMLDTALSASNPPVLPRWCASEQIGIIDDPMLLIHGHQRYLSIPMNTREARRFIRKSEPFDMKIDIVDGISFVPTVCQIPVNSISILNPQWTTKVEPYLKQTCVAQTLQLDPNQIELKVSNLLLLEPCQFPRQFTWSKDKQNPSTIAKLFISLPSIYNGGKETITYYKEKHVFDLSEKDSNKSSFYTIVPMSNECKHEIDFISSGYKLVLVYDIISLSSNIFYNVDINETIMIRVGRILETYIRKLENDYQGYLSKIILPFSDTFIMGNNPLLHGNDRVIGTILRRTIEQYHSDKFLLYQGIIQPNRSNDGTVHACRLLTDLNLIVPNKTNTLFNHIDLCLGNCNETYSGNIFLRKTRTDQGNFVSFEQFTVPIWCIVPVNHKYNILIDNIPRVLTHLEHNLIPHHHYTEAFLLIDWLLTTTKKINFNTKSLLHQLVRLLPNKTITDKVIVIIRQLFEHKKFLEQFFPMILKQEYDDIVYLLKYSKDTNIQLYIHQVFQNVLKRKSRDKDKIRLAIKFIGILSTRNIDLSFLLVLIHELLSNIFKPNNPMLSINDLANLLALLSISIDSFQPSCQIISQQIIRQIKITAIKFIGILSTRNIDLSFLLVLIHELLSNIFKPNNPMLSINDLANLLALLSISIDSFQPSCQIISQQIIRQIKITTTTTMTSSTTTHLLRAVLVPTLIQIHRQFIDATQTFQKRKRTPVTNFPPWFLSLYQTCLSLLNAYCNSSPPIPTYDNISDNFQTHYCSICEELFTFLQNTNIFEKTFLIPKNKIYHFNKIINKFTPLIINVKSMTSDNENHQIYIMKMSTDDEEIWRENNLLRSLLTHIQLSNDSEDQSDMTRSKRFKSSL